MKRVLLAIVLCSLLISCDGPALKHSDTTTLKAAIPTKNLEIERKGQKPVAETKTKEAEIYSYPCAIFTEPTKNQIDSLKKVYSEQEYAGIIDDNLYYIATASDLFKAKGLKMINKEPIGTVKFRKANGNIAEMDLNNFLWNVVLFNGKNEPIEADLTTIEEEYNRYMK